MESGANLGRSRGAWQPPRLMLIPLLFLLLLLTDATVSPANCLPAGRSHPLERRDARIGIVGAGPAGLHMAYLLRALNYTNILVLEAAARVGGRSVSLSDDQQPDVTHELGTCYLSSEYRDFYRMARGINYPPETVPLPKAVVRTADGGQQDLDRFILDRVRRLDPGLSPGSSDAEVQRRIVCAAQRYVQTRQEFFPAGQPDYLEFPMVRPPSELMSRLNCTLRQFLETNQLMPLEPFFLLGMTAMGYGSANDTSALYGLMWMTPAYLCDLSGIQRNSSGLRLLRRGFQNFWNATWDRLVSQGGVEFRFNSRVSRVARSQTSVQLEWSSDGALLTKTIDWLIWTPSVLRTVAATFNSLTPTEAAAFGGLSARKFRTQLVRLTGAQEPAVAANPVAYYLDALDSRPSLDRLLAVRNSAKVLLLTTSLNAPLDTPLDPVEECPQLNISLGCSPISASLQNAPPLNNPANAPLNVPPLKNPANAPLNVLLNAPLNVPPLNAPPLNAPPNAPLNTPPLNAPPNAPLNAPLLNAPRLPTYTLVTYYLSDYGDTSSSDVDKLRPSGPLLDGGEQLANATFDYMPRYSVRDMAAGALWRLLDDVNGAKDSRTWFAGHSVVFDSVKSVMKYNKMLLHKAIPYFAKHLAEI